MKRSNNSARCSLTAKNHLIGREVQQRSTIDHTPGYLREVVKRALDIGTGALVQEHNHPSGDPTSSKENIAMMSAIVDACCELGLVAHDHIIIGYSGVVSFKSLGLL